jgi:hypothetical protein
VVAEELFLCDAAVNVKEQWILVKGYLWRDAKDYVFLDERLTVNLVVWKFPLYPTAYHILELLQIAGEVVSEAAK